ncbi:MAG: hypothetical protein KDH98_16920 [Calditrichaeota bacterium]|nr:hypothetical protein [Calditrichota bacterium]
MSIFKMVVFPLPLVPINASVLPSEIENHTAFTAGWSPEKVLEIDSTRMVLLCGLFIGNNTVNGAFLQQLNRSNCANSSGKSRK